MTSLIVITFKIGQSAGKKPTSALVRIWFSHRDRTGVGLRNLTNFNDSLRYSPDYIGNYIEGVDSPRPTASNFRRKTVRRR